MANNQQSTVQSNTPRKSSVPDCEFDRPTTVDDLYKLASLGAEIISNVAQHIGFENEVDAAWRIVSRAHSEVVSAHGFICGVKFVGLAEWQKKERGAA